MKEKKDTQFKETTWGLYLLKGPTIEEEEEPELIKEKQHTY